MTGKKDITLDTIQLLLALIITAIMAFPVLWMVTTAMKPSSELLVTTPRLLPRHLDLTSFLSVQTHIPLARYLFNTALVTVVTLFLQVSVGVIAAYGFAKGRFIGRDMLFILVIGAMMVPEQVTFIPLYTLCAKLGWVNTYMGIILPNAVSAYFIFMVRQAFLTVDQSYIDAGKLDGLGTWGIIWKIMVPLCRATIITVAMVSVIGSWNSYFWPKIITNKDECRMIATGIVRLYDSFGTGDLLESTNIIMAGALISVVPIVLLFVIFQRYMLSGFSRAVMK